MKKLLVFIAVSSLLLACNNDAVVPNLANLDGQENLIGVWEYDSYEQLTDTTGAEIYRKVNKIATDKTGITFKNNGVFLSKQNAGWCGTPPISYAEYDGTFNVGDKNVLNINTKYWGGKSSYKMEVLELSNRELRVRTFDYAYDQPF